MNHAAGIHVHARTTCAEWAGERLDVGWAINVLHPLAQRPSSIDVQADGACCDDAREVLATEAQPQATSTPGVAPSIA
jgi:hypothetical protein